ncbi:helix-turn-helix transcriptional regulator [Amphritea sp. 1_MG-2023]|uniref:ArsR/SmtB family transcription factor n=1 Tax=Amphritea sp. 1_MG-2023 TaxID=3062670 RepID=UPI0026E4165E|nr:helix-turn-helix transcriptional regulator [Amphritea sp. 1_MG-2023]MDO6563613.1 helix-turn-helix transcriptional regulator [Amphritea sp. 1_MG-2023]
MSAAELDEMIKALSHPVRREILHWLKQPELLFADQEHPLSFGVCAGMIARQAGLSQSTVSAHLTTLQRAGFLSSKKLGQWNFFMRNETVIQQFIARLNEQL